MALILDTNALSAVADEQPGITAALAKASLVGIPAVVLGEYRFGIAQSRLRSHYEGWLCENLPSFRVLDITNETSVFYGEIRLELKRSGTPIPSNDLWIAALSREHNLPILTRDRHFDCVAGIRRVIW